MKQVQKLSAAATRPANSVSLAWSSSQINWLTTIIIRVSPSVCGFSRPRVSPLSICTRQPPVQKSCGRLRIVFSLRTPSQWLCWHRQKSIELERQTTLFRRRSPSAFILLRVHMMMRKHLTSFHLPLRRCYEKSRSLSTTKHTSWWRRNQPYVSVFKSWSSAASSTDSDLPLRQTSSVFSMMSWEWKNAQSVSAMTWSQSFGHLIRPSIRNSST